MPQSNSAKKSLRQNTERRARNRELRGTTRTQIKKLDAAVADGNADEAQSQLKATVKALDKTVAKGIMHKNTASRAKSRLTRRVNQLAAKP